MISNIDLLDSVVQGTFPPDALVRVVKHDISLISLWKTYIDLRNNSVGLSQWIPNQSSIKQLSLKKIYEEFDELLPLLINLKMRVASNSTPLAHSLLCCCKELITLLLKNKDMIPNAIKMISPIDMTAIEDEKVSEDFIFAPRTTTAGQKLEDTAIRPEDEEYQEYKKVDSQSLAMIEIYKIALTVAQALSSLHARNIIHGAVSMDAVVTRGANTTRNSIMSLMILTHNEEKTMSDDIRAFGVLLRDLLTTCSDKETHYPVFQYLSSLCSTCLATQPQDQINALDLKHSLSIPYFLFQAITLCPKKSISNCFNRAFQTSSAANATFKWPIAHHPNLTDPLENQVSLKDFLDKTKNSFDPDTQKEIAACWGIQMLTTLTWATGTGFYNISIRPDTVCFDNNGLVNMLATLPHADTNDVYNIIQLIYPEAKNELQKPMNNIDAIVCMQLPFFRPHLPLQVEPSDHVKILGITDTTFTGQFNQWTALRYNQDTPDTMKIALDEAFIELTEQWISPSKTKLKKLFNRITDKPSILTSSSSEWTIMHTLETHPHIHAVTFLKEFKERLHLSPDDKCGVVKIISIEDSAKESILPPIRRATSILYNAQHPNIIRLLAASKQETTGHIITHIITEFMNLGSLDMVMNNLTTTDHAVLKKFFMAVTVQVLMGLYFLHTKPKVAHNFVNASHVLLNKEGRVKLCSFGAICGRLTKQKNTVATDLQDLANMIESLFTSRGYEPNVDTDVQLVLSSLREPNATAESILNLPVFSQLYTKNFDVFQGKTDEEKKAADLLKKWLDIKEGFEYSFSNVFEKWQQFDETGAYKNDRHALRTILKNWLLNVEKSAISQTREVLQQYAADFYPFGREIRK